MLQSQFTARNKKIERTHKAVAGVIVLQFNQTYCDILRKSESSVVNFPEMAHKIFCAGVLELKTAVMTPEVY